MNHITTILFDMYGVILEESKGNFIPYTFQHFGKEEHERLIRQFKKEQLFTKAGNGEITSNTFLTILGYDNPEYHMRTISKTILHLIMPLFLSQKNITHNMSLSYCQMMFRNGAPILRIITD